MQRFIEGFEKAAKMSSEQRAAHEKELYDFNRKDISIPKAVGVGATAGGLLGASSLVGAGAVGAQMGNVMTGMTNESRLKSVGKGALLGMKQVGLKGVAAGAGLGAAGLGGLAAYQKYKGPGYLKKVEDKDLSRNVKASRKYEKGDKKAMNVSYWEGLADRAKTPEEKQKWLDAAAKEK